MSEMVSKIKLWFYEDERLHPNYSLFLPMNKLHPVS